MRLPQFKSLLAESVGSILDGEELSTLLDTMADATSGDYDVPDLSGGIDDLKELQQSLLNRFGLNYQDIELSDTSYSDEEAEWMRRLKGARLNPTDLMQEDRTLIAMTLSLMYRHAKVSAHVKGGGKKWRDTLKPKEKENLKSIMKKIGFSGVELTNSNFYGKDKKSDPFPKGGRGDPKSSQIPDKPGGWSNWTDPWAGRVGEGQALDLLDEFGPALEKAGIKISGMPRVLGDDKGAQGTPVDIGGTVLKFTKDRTEANSSYRIKGKKLKNVANVYNVYQLDETHVFVIHQELLDPLDKEIKSGWYTYRFRDNINSFFKKKDKERARRFLEDELDYRKPDPKVAQKMRDALEQALNGAEELMANKVIAPDRHYENVMQRPDGTIVLIDLGLSRSPEVNVPQVDAE
jgi:hypothetical protein